MFPESPSTASKESINIAECHTGRLIEFTFNQTAHALTAMTEQHSRYIGKQIFTKNKKWKKEQITTDAIYLLGKFPKVCKFCPLFATKTFVIG